MSQLAIEVWNGDTQAGQAFFTRARRGQGRGGVSTTFIYEPSYLAHGGIALDPALPLVPGAQYVPGLPGAFSDTAPDRWGRNLIDKQEREQARVEQRAPRTLDEIDYLLRVSDNTRQGALRFRIPASSTAEGFVGADSAVPPLLELPALLRAADDASQIQDAAGTHEAVKLLLQTGTTGLGGARPKAAVRLENGALAIAKFPHSSDEWDVMAWEAVSLDILARAQCLVPQYRLTRVGERSILLLRRFDRLGDTRIGYISALTAVGARDGEQRDYVDIADTIRDLSASPHSDLRELFRRVVVSVAIGNTDDHLRNHGFLADLKGWRLAPAFDVNPAGDLSTPRATALAGADSFPEEVAALGDVAEACSISAAERTEIVSGVLGAIADWENLAIHRGISQRERSRFAELFAARGAQLRSVA